MWHKVSPEVESIAATVVNFTGELIKLQANPTVQSIEALLAATVPECAPIITAIESALPIVSAVETTLNAPTTAEKLNGLLKEAANLSPALAKKQIFTLASEIVKILSAETTPLTTSESDAITQLKIIVSKA